MEVRLTEEQETFVRLAVERGRFSRPDEAVHDAMNRWVEMERQRMEIIAAIDESEADFAAGRFTEYTEENSHELAEKIIREARAERDQRHKRPA
jgi:Arc/MetJ-type ribon-helix-helix transcriptional regulator